MPSGAGRNVLFLGKEAVYSAEATFLAGLPVPAIAESIGRLARERDIGILIR